MIVHIPLRQYSVVSHNFRLTIVIMTLISVLVVHTCMSEYDVKYLLQIVKQVYRFVYNNYLSHEVFHCMMIKPLH